MIPRHWLRLPVAPEQIQRLAEPPAWSRDWQRLAEQIEPGDQVWTYEATDANERGCALVRGLDVIGIVVL